VFAIALSAAMLAGPDLPGVLIFSRTSGFRHGSIETAAQALRDIGADRWRLMTTEDPSIFTAEALAETDVVVFMNTTGDVLDANQQAVMAAWLRGGGGWVGVHAAADTEYDWPFYGKLLGGGWFKSHPSIQPADIRVEDISHPTLSHVPPIWNRVDEWYNFMKSPRSDVHVLASLDESSYSGGAMGDHPIAWTVPIGKGVAFYTGLGHTNESWKEPAFLAHVARAIDWTAGDGWIEMGSLDGRTWAHRAGWRAAGSAVSVGRGLDAEDGDGVLINTAGGHAGDLVSHATFGDCEVEIEFMVPEGGNSGVYLQGRYEVQILDSFGKAKPGSGDCGGIYERWDESRSPSGFEGVPPRANASRPAGVWQRYRIVFRAPRFGENGVKEANARFERVTHNGIVIHEDVELRGPTRGGQGVEAAEGPLRLQGDHGPIAYRNLRVRRIGPADSHGADTPRADHE